MSKKLQKAVELPKTKKKPNSFVNTVKGIALMFGVASTYLMAGIIYMGADSYIAFAVTVPAVAIATVTLAIVFSKAFK